MWKVDYSPKALEDLQSIKAYVIENFGVDTAHKALGKITASVRRLEEYPLLGMSLGKMIDVSTDYMHIFIEMYYVFYRIEGNIVKIVRVLNERQDFMKILFEIHTSFEEDEDC
ncbi:type II toxin-antitoxin system RelE/ParE family toxin [Alkaliphilus peptidifermentans]|uniref:Addiction module toxin, RelE/StbE family n=1 Tax=Alkaliphilus peptidifermentans DSM 18978 TaxID=1120976 RepID=A0A1G5BSU7_9FIRM|nr:type II toxin-antitoxin system RelE/ParE family toxin [Alkaliphilus peptidifermentans]SCX93289.1 addiction module toxin, RelE/StbE family [Alkaliphilus peptidifermentans DSM 18978]